MSTELEHPLDYLPELALGVLPETDAAPVRSHLASCDSCAAEYAEMTRVAGFLPLATLHAEPSPTVKAGLMQRIAHEPRQIRPAVRVRWWLAVAAAAAILLGSGLAAGLVIGRSQNDEANLRAQVEAARAETKRETLLAAAAARGTLQSSDARDGSAWAAFVRAPGASWGYAWVNGLPPLGSGQSYQAWFSKDGETYEPSAAFGVNSGGVWLWADSSIDTYTELALTVENSVGDSAPKGPVVLKVDLQKK